MLGLFLPTLGRGRVRLHLKGSGISPGISSSCSLSHGNSPWVWFFPKESNKSFTQIQETPEEATENAKWLPQHLWHIQVWAALPCEKEIPLPVSSQCKNSGSNLMIPSGNRTSSSLRQLQKDQQQPGNVAAFKKC